MLSHTLGRASQCLTLAHTQHMVEVLTDHPASGIHLMSFEKKQQHLLMKIMHLFFYTNGEKFTFCFETKQKCNHIQFLEPKNIVRVFECEIFIHCHKLQTVLYMFMYFIIIHAIKI